MSKFLYNNDNKAIETPRVFSENSHAKNQLSFLPANPFNLNNSKILSYGRADITKVKNVIL